MSSFNPLQPRPLLSGLGHSANLEAFMKVAVDCNRLNVLLQNWGRYASMLDTFSGQMAKPQIQAYPALEDVHNDLQIHSKNIRQLKAVLEAALSEYSTTENRLCALSSSNDTQASIDSNVKKTDVGQLFFATSVVLSNLRLLFGDAAWEMLGGLNKVSSFIKDAGDYSEWIDVLLDSDTFEGVSDFLGDIGKNDLFKVTGYLGDGKKLVDALNDGNLDALESLAEKYAKKGVKLGIKSATGVKVSGVVNSVYLDLGWNLGENAVESIQDFIDAPSPGSGLSGLWNMTAGTFFDAGTSLAEDALSFVGDITGQGFDNDDFGNAMDYLWHHPIKSAVATGEVIVDGVASFFDWLF